MTDDSVEDIPDLFHIKTALGCGLIPIWPLRPNPFPKKSQVAVADNYEHHSAAMKGEKSSCTRKADAILTQEVKKNA